MGAIFNAPVILDVGKTSRKSIKELKAGRGKLLDDVQHTMAEVTTSMGERAEGKQFVPVVILYRKKAKKRKGIGRGLLPILG